MKVNDKERRRWECDIRRAISNAGHIPDVMIGMVAYSQPDRSLHCKSIVTLHDLEPRPENLAALADHVDDKSNLMGILLGEVELLIQWQLRMCGIIHPGMREEFAAIVEDQRRRTMQKGDGEQQ